MSDSPAPAAEPPSTAPLADLAAVDRLRDDFAACGYDAEHVPALFGPDAHHALGRGYRWPALHVTARAAAAGSPLATVTRLFLLGTGEPADQVAAALPSLGLDGALACGVVEFTDDETSGPAYVRATVDIRPHADEVRSYLVVSDFDTDARPGPLRPDHVLGIGSASMTLARAVIRRPVRRVLDLGTGCGIQALHATGHADAVTATDTNPRALTLAGATARLNGFRWDLRHGSLFEPVAGEQFDLIVANPPFVISGGARRFAYRDSGMPGDDLCRRLVEQLPDHLAPGGTAQVLANWMIRDDADWRQTVGGWVAGTGLDGWVVQRDVARPADYVSLWLADAGEVPGDGTGTDPSGDAATLAGEWLDYFARERVTGIGMGSITLRRPVGPRTGTPDVVFDELTGPEDALTGAEIDAFLARRGYLANLTDRDLLARTLSLASTDVLHERHVPGPDGWSPVLRMLRRPGGPGATVQLDEWGAAVFAGCTGTAPLGVLVDLLATAHGIDPAALADAVLPTVRVAITRGLLHPVDLAGSDPS